MLPTRLTMDLTTSYGRPKMSEQSSPAVLTPSLPRAAWLAYDHARPAIDDGLDGKCLGGFGTNVAFAVYAPFFEAAMPRTTGLGHSTNWV